MRSTYWYYQSNNNPQLPISSNKDYCLKKKYCDYFDLGNKAPAFALDAVYLGERTRVSLSDYIGKWVVLFFYGSDFTFV